jgi:hypothetical protein
MNTFTINAPDLDNMLTGTVLATDKNFPMLACVHLEYKAGELIAVATDRYRLHIARLSGDNLETLPAESFVIDINRDDVKNIRSFIKPLTGRAINPRVTVTINESKVTISTDTGEITFLAFDGTFPPYEQLIPTEFNPVERMAVNPAFLADIAKLPGIDKAKPLVLKFTAENKPLLAELAADPIKWTVLLMPMRTA